MSLPKKKSLVGGRWEVRLKVFGWLLFVFFTKTKEKERLYWCSAR